MLYERYISKFIFIVTLIFFLILLLISFFAWQKAEEANRNKLQFKFEQEILKIENAIKYRIDDYIETLYGLRGLFAQDSELTHAGWQKYCDALDIRKRVPGVHSLSFNEYVTTERLGEFIRSVRLDRTFSPDGFLDFKVTFPFSPVGSMDSAQNKFFILKYIWPWQGNEAAHGVELYSDPERKELLDHCLETGKPVTSAGIDLVGDIKSSLASFVIYLPVYKFSSATDPEQGSRGNVLGVVAAMFRSDEVINHALMRINRQPHIDFEIYNGIDIGENSLFFDDDTLQDAQIELDNPLRRLVRLDIFGQPWTCHFHADEEFGLDEADAYLPMVVLIAGILISILISVSFMVLAASRKRAIAIAASINRKYESQRSLSMRSDRLRSLGQMAAGIAHELNQPLVGVRGLAEHIHIAIDRKWDLSSDKIRDKVSQIIDQADRMTHIIDHVRIFAREAGKPELSPGDANEIAESCIRLLGAQFRSHGINLECEKNEGLPKIMVNPFSLEEVIINLLLNARDAVEEKMQTKKLDAPRVKIKTGVLRQRRKPKVQIEVEDNGPGIPVEIQEKIFDPFYTTKEPNKGTGLGLSISKSIIEEMNGTLEFESVLGSGSVFTITLNAIKQKD